jgi:AsmA protein
MFSLLKFSAVDMNLKLAGDSLDQLFPLLGIAAPVTRAYTTQGHLVHSQNNWRYDNFSGRFGASDIAGFVQVETGGKRTLLTAELVSKQLEFEDLGPLIGAKPGSVDTARQMATSLPSLDQNTNGSVSTPLNARVLPNLPFQTARWGSMDADVKLNAKSIRRARELPLENFQAHLKLSDSVLTLDPIDFAMAGGHLSAVVSLDGRNQPIHAHARVMARKIQLSKLLPTVDLNKASIGKINGDFDLTGSGNSIRQMLASANGKMAMLVEGGQISRLMMEKAGLHLWEILELSLSGDRPIILRCAVAEFDVQKGKMRADALVFDTQVTTLLGVGSIDLAQESLDLTFNQKTKRTSPLALRSPIYIRGSFAKPSVGVDKGKVAVRALGAVALGLVNPLLALIPLIDPGPGKDSDCGQLVLDAKQGRPN